MNQNGIITSAMAAFSTVVGAAAGYFYAKRALTSKYNDIAEKEIADAKLFYAALNKRGDFETPASAARTLVRDTAGEAWENAVEALTQYQGVSPTTKKPEVNVRAPQSKSPDQDKPAKGRILFEGVELDEDEWDAEDQDGDKEDGEPYVISEKDWSTDDNGFERESLTYYSADEVLVDANEAVIDDIKNTVGRKNMLKFGRGSGDPNVVFVRNEKLGCDFEVILHTGSYAEEVLGLVETDDVIEHSSMRRRRAVLEE